ncbi:MAG: hypothetical protein JWO52_5939 [Gammaproteobacteria bacterium]|nr:hypothetical protein [Gammaproteobacteria bacterium]
MTNLTRTLSSAAASAERCVTRFRAIHWRSMSAIAANAKSNQHLLLAFPSLYGAWISA